MLQRVFIHLSFILLFAFTQMGVVTHEISHLNQPAQQTQPDKNSATETCGQCIAYAQAASGVPSANFIIPSSEAQFHLATVYVAHLATALTPSYSARAPPASLII